MISIPEAIVNRVKLELRSVPSSLVYVSMKESNAPLIQIRFKKTDCEEVQMERRVRLLGENLGDQISEFTRDIRTAYFRQRPQKTR